MESFIVSLVIFTAIFAIFGWPSANKRRADSAFTAASTYPTCYGTSVSDDASALATGGIGKHPAECTAATLM